MSIHDYLQCEIGKTAFFERLSFEVLDFEGLLSTLIDLFASTPSFAPDKYGAYDPLKSPYTAEGFASLARAQRVSDTLHMIGRERFDFIRVESPLDSVDYMCSAWRIERGNHDRLGRFWDQLALRLRSDLAIAHSLSEHECEHARALNLVDADRAGVRYHALIWYRLAFGIPDLAWTTYFGPMYIEHFGRRRLLSCPAYDVQEMSPDLIRLQLTSSIADVIDDWEAFQASRKRAIEHLGVESFQRARLKGDPGPLGSDDLNGVPATSVPSRLRPIRERFEAQYRAEREAPPALTSLDEMVKQPHRFRVVKLPGPRKVKNIVVVDTLRQEMLGFADNRTRDEFVNALISAGAEVQDLTKARSR
jgi:hypothetical protein